MKKFALLLAIIPLIFSSSKAQDAGLEKSTFGLQLARLGLLAYHEAKLAEKLALRTELGYDIYYNGMVLCSLPSRSISYRNMFHARPVITVQPRFYYNLAKRSESGMQTAGNSGNFFALSTSYHPGTLIIRRSDFPDYDMISFTPMWGMRRTFGKRFDWEAGLGVSYQISLLKSAGYSNNTHLLDFPIHLRLGMTLN